MISIEKLKREWHEARNSPLKMESLSKGSSRRVWWICEKGHEWKTRYSNRINGTGCPYCAGKKVLPGYNDLASLFPEVSAEWHPELNGNLRPDMVLAHSNKYVWWRCLFGHEWRTKINNRTSLGTCCPKCAGKEPIQGETDLLAQYPTIAAQWHPHKNDQLTPEMVLPQSNKKVWWICGRKHEWKARIDHRVHGNGCPYCCGQKAIPGETDLETLAPHIAKQWHPTKNKNRHPSEYTLHSHARMWWRCELGHEWQSTINNRSKCGCPICSGRVVLKGYNDLATAAPAIAAEWCNEKNGGMGPDRISPHCNDPYYWICPKNHIWKTSPNNRVNGTGCPFCNKQRLIPSENSLAVVFPAIAKEWNDKMNFPLTPLDVTAYCNDKHWWLCENGHAWEAVVSNRAKGDRCTGRYAIKEKNDLSTQYPQIANEWCVDKNGDKRPDQYLPQSNEKVWWRCNAGHEWMATIASRTAGSGCARCKGRHSNIKNLI